MKWSSKPFSDYVHYYTSTAVRNRAGGGLVKNIDIDKGRIRADIQGTALYEVNIRYNKDRVLGSSCSCPFDQGPVCKHVVQVLFLADQMQLREQQKEDLENADFHATDYLIADRQISTLTYPELLKHATEIAVNRMQNGRRYVSPQHVEINRATFHYSPSYYHEFEVVLVQDPSGIILRCDCEERKRKLCEHQAVVLNYVQESDNVRLFFDHHMRQQLLREKAAEYGLENEADLDPFFRLELERGHLRIVPEIKGLVALDSKSAKKLEKGLIPRPFSPESTIDKTPKKKEFLLIGGTAVTMTVRLYQGNETKEGGVKNPLLQKNALDNALKTNDPELLKCYAMLANFQRGYRSFTPFSEITPQDFLHEMQELKAVLNNPEQLPYYIHDDSVSDNITAKSVVPVSLHQENVSMHLDVIQNGVFFEITATIDAGNHHRQLERMQFAFRYFLKAGNQLFLIDNLDFLRTIEYLKTHHNKLIIHESKFQEFRERFLSQLESKLTIKYAFLKPAPLKMVQQTGLNDINEHLIYLTDSENFVNITPVIRYGTVEIPVLSGKQLQTLDQAGNAFLVERNKQEEERFIRHITELHPDFEEQNGNEFYYLHKQRFLDEHWFLTAFEAWNKLGYKILGFNKLKNNRYNPNSMTVRVQVSSETDWFDTHIKVKFGEQDATLKQIQRSVVNRTKYVQLGDGTLGVLPDEWMEKFSHYFRSGDLAGESIRTSKVNYKFIDELYEKEVLTQEAKKEISLLKEKVLHFDRIDPVKPPKGLNATLRDYQKEGLNWLHFLDEFGFGGCLADDMGLGKTIQVLAFILSMREKNGPAANLVVVPTSLLFNWQAEAEKFAPGLQVLTIYGNNRPKNDAGFEAYDIILTTYGTLLTDITYLKKFRFNYIFLDESQAIKNPDSKRYKTVRLLQARNRVVLTGTPVENRTTDLYAQFSFAIPGLFGTFKRFQDDYGTPIDRFKDSQRAKELQQRISPFLLRRTKKQVAKELPEKTEMVLYCEMGAEQRRVYETYKKEFQTFLQGSSSIDYARGSMHILQGLTKLRQICNSPALLADEEFYGSESSKIAELMEQIETTAVNHKILIFSQFVGMLELIRPELESRGIDYAWLTGQTRDRAGQVDRFQNDPDVRVFLISLKAGGTGLNLTEAEYVFIVDPWWNPAVENQAIDRCYRIGQQKNVMAVRLICPDTIEEKIMRLQDSKRALADELVHTDSSMLKSLSRDELMWLCS